MRDLAAKAGVTQATISCLELLRESANSITAERIAAALGVEVSALLGEEEPPEADPPTRPEETAASVA